MRILKKAAFLIFLSLFVNAYAETSRIELKDGSVIKGEVVSLEQGVYTIDSQTFGKLKISQNNVAKIESENPAQISPITSPQKQDALQSQVNSYKQAVMQNPENAAVVKELSQDPKLKELSSDPSIQAAAQSGDIQALMDNPKFMEIVNSPEMQEAVKKIKK